MWTPTEMSFYVDGGKYMTVPIDYWIDWIRLYQKDGEEIRFPGNEKAGE